MVAIPKPIPSSERKARRERRSQLREIIRQRFSEMNLPRLALPALPALPKPAQPKYPSPRTDRGRKALASARQAGDPVLLDRCRTTVASFEEQRLKCALASARLRLVEIELRRKA